MSPREELRRRVRHILQPMMAMALIGYFGFHAIEGDRGALALMRLRAEAADVEARRTAAAAERLRWETRVGHLKAASLDRDLLEERARGLLNLTGRGDVIVLTPVERPMPPTGLAQR